MLRVGEMLSDAIVDAMGNTVTVSEVERLTASFTRIRLTGPALRTATWMAGDKLRIRPYRGTFDVRTFTPFGWNADQGSCDLLAFDHGVGPAAQWFRTVAEGARCDIFGPLRSIDPTTPAVETAFVGDETSVALAHALRQRQPRCRLVFESTDAQGLEMVLAALGIEAGYTELHEKTSDRGALLDHVARDASCGRVIVTGDAATIGAIRSVVRRWPAPRPMITGRAFWASGRTGLS